MKKGWLALSLLALFVFPALSFSEVHIGVNIPVGGPPPGYYQPAPQVFQGTVIQSYGGNVVLQLQDGRQLNFYITPQTQIYGGLAIGSVISINAYPANGYWYAQSVNTVYANYAEPQPYPYAYPQSYPVPYPVYTYPYYPHRYYYPGYIQFGFGWGGRGGWHDHDGGHRGGWQSGHRR